MILPVAAFQLFVPCVLGTIVVMKGDKFYDDVCKLPWHLMSVTDQKSIQMIIGYASKPKQLSAGVKILNMETFVEVFKNALNYFNILK